MNPRIYFIILLVGFGSYTSLANDKYVDAMKKNIDSIYHAQTPAQYQAAINAIERIASVETNKWEPQYYISFGYIMMANIEKETSKKDDYLDQAMSAIEKAKALAPKESEVIALEGFAYMIRLTVDPMARGQHYSMMSLQSFNQAVELNPENPRALGLLAQMQYGTAKFFGSSTSDACALNGKALEKFDSYSSQNPLAPVWGKQMTEAMIEQCK